MFRTSRRKRKKVHPDGTKWMDKSFVAKDANEVKDLISKIIM